MWKIRIMKTVAQEAAVKTALESQEWVGADAQEAAAKYAGNSCSSCTGWETTTAAAVFAAAKQTCTFSVCGKTETRTSSKSKKVAVTK